MPNSPKAPLFFYRRNLESLLYECSYDLMQQKFYNMSRFHKMCDLISMLLSPKNIALCYISSAYITYCCQAHERLTFSYHRESEKVLPEKAPEKPNICYNSNGKTLSLG